MPSARVCVPCSQISNRKVKEDFVFNLAREEKYRTEERLVGAVGASGFKPNFMVMYACCYFQSSQKTYAGKFLSSGSLLYTSLPPFLLFNCVCTRQALISAWGNMVLCLSHILKTLS